jgi:predicted signal transduction protein with EAL and GGDEF domain
VGAGDLRGVVVEITEQIAVADYDALIAALAPVRVAGALLAIDDAGAGFASLKHVMLLRPDFVKVDRDLVAGIDRDETKAAVVEAFGLVTSRLDAWLIAEGVETTAELDCLLSLRVPLVQRLADVTRRVGSRPARDRHVPLVLCDERGRLLGLVTVERLLDRLADTLDFPCST